MGIATRYWLHCDGCRRVGPGPMNGSDSRTIARRDARRAGWVRVPKGWHGPQNARRYSDGEDYCPVCARQRGLK
jgi:hypothetical protein